ncbi:MAG: beta-N-acetylhexosaminidase [Phycisphaerales bacterium]
MSASADKPLLIPSPRSFDPWIDELYLDQRLVADANLPAVVAQLLSADFTEQHRLTDHPWSVGELVVGHDADVPPGGYILKIRPRDPYSPWPIRLRPRDRQGLRAGLATLRQLLSQYGSSLPCLTISDAPAFPTRGVMLDVSRNKVPTLAQLRQTVDLLASLKFNHLQLYTEHAFAYKGHEEVWHDASPLTPDDVRDLDAYCAARGIDLAANQNCFGHLAVFLKRPRYAHLAEIEGDNTWKFMQFDRRGPFSLCPILPESQAFVRDLLDQLLPCFSGGLVNIGCDEAFDVGWGRSKAEVERRAAARAARDAGPSSADHQAAKSRVRAELYFEFVNKVCAIVREHGKRPQFWADIAMSQPDMLDRLPKDLIGLAWGYEPDAKFAEECRQLREHGLEAWVCPGTSSWRTFTGRTSESRANIAAAAEQGLSNAAAGFLVCDWGDVGHMQQWPITLARLADAAEAAWGGRLPLDADSIAERDTAAALHVFGDPGGRITRWLNDLGDVDLPLRRESRVRNASAIFNDLFPPVPPPPGRRSINAPAEEFEAARQALEALPPPPRLPDPLINDELAHALACTRLGIDHALSCRRSPDGLAPRPEDRPALRDLAESCLREHRRLWLLRNRPGGLDESAKHLQRVIDSLSE